MNDMAARQEPVPNELHTSAPASVDETQSRAQAIDPGIPAGGGGGAPTGNANTDDYPRSVEEMGRERLAEVINQQTDFVHLTRLEQHTTPQTDLAIKADSNEGVWNQFIEEQLFATRRVTLDYFHLFEWFPLAPGKFHTPDARSARIEADNFKLRAPDGSYFYTPAGKGLMIEEGGVGAVRLRPTEIHGENFYFMTASANGVCHEGFPILIPEIFYGQLKQRMLGVGAVSAVLSGEMKLVPQDALTFFGNPRAFPQIYLHVDDIRILDKPRPEVTRFYVSVAVSFQGNVQGTVGNYMTYCTFDPGSKTSLDRAIDWIDNFYVQNQYKGTVITDFDDVYPHFPNAVFELAALRSGNLDMQKAVDFLKANWMDQAASEKFRNYYQAISPTLRLQVVMGNQYNFEGGVTGNQNVFGNDNVVNNSQRTAPEPKAGTGQ